ncbi:hypothetical protein RB195_026005 [Necator americanus]|uniref:Uncharacterized protein n=2 Tax=Necator americanus TaxID=51031 RepID=A0ABR1EUZ0_NECAM|nr:CBS domain protein [Necator americanus]ETN69048.1 CBS domain protein [Necator americanus]
MLETTKPLNVYCNSESGYDSPHASTDSSRRNSIGFKEYVKSRRFTMMSKPNRVTVPIPSTCDASRKTSSSDSNFCDAPDDLDDELSPRPVYQRRMSVPEKVFHSADYAILRPSMEADVKFEIVAAFDRYTDPYRHYMQSLTCYDLQPTHGAVVVIDGELKIHKALTALSQCGHQVAIVSNLDVRGGLGIITVTDCLKAIVLASEGVQNVAEQTVAQFLKSNNRKQLVTADVNTSVWDAAKMICLNRIHRIPIVHFDEVVGDAKKQQGNLLYVLSLKTVFMETIMKLSDPKPSLCPHIKQRTISERKLGTWSRLYTVPQTATCDDAITLYLEKKISSVPVVDSCGRVLGVIGKSDIMLELVRHPNNYLEILDIPIMDLIASMSPPVYGTTTMTVFDCIAALVNTDRQSIVIIDVERRPQAVISYSDIMDFIQNSSDSHHKLSLA